MSDIVCPICLGQSFVEFRGRANAQCVSCDSLERHRLFKLFLLWVGSSRSSLYLSTVGPLERLDQYESWLTVERLDSIDQRSLSAEEAHSSCVFLENIVGFKEVDLVEKQRIRAMMKTGSLMAFTCHSGYEEKRRADVTSLLGNDVTHKHFDPREVYGEGVSDQFGLNMSKSSRGRGDIYYYQAERMEVNTDSKLEIVPEVSCRTQEVTVDRHEKEESKQWSTS